MDLSRAMDPFASRFYSYSGYSFNAQLLAIPMEESSTYFFLPRRILKLYPASPAKPGDRIRDESTKKEYLAGENGPSVFSNKIIHKTLKLFEITHKSAPYSTRVTVTDSVTGLKKTVDTNDITIPCVIEFAKTQEDEMRVGADLVRIIAAVALKPNDIVAGYTIVNSEPQLGLYFATARRA